MDVLTLETCWAVNSEIIKQVTSSWSVFVQLSSSRLDTFLSGLFVNKIYIVLSQNRQQAETPRALY